MVHYVRDTLATVFSDAGLLHALPPQSRNVTRRALSFVALSRSGCMCEDQIASVDRRFPHKAFCLLTNPERAQEFQDDVPRCLFDAFILALLRTFGRFDSPAFLHCLSAVATVHWSDIAQLESRNATLRRLATVLSAQTHTIDIEQLSALWVLLQGRKRQRKEQEASVDAPFQATTKRSKVRKTTKRKGRGGTFRAFTRLVTFGAKGRPDIRALSAQYRAEKQARSERYIQAERMGSAAARAGKCLPSWASAFGPRSAELRRAASRRGLEVLNQRTPYLSDAQRASTIAQHVMHDGATLTQGVSAARAVNRMRRKREREEEANRADALAEYQRGAGAALVRRLICENPALGNVNLIALPCAVGACVRVGQSSPERIADALSWSAANARESNLSAALSAIWSSTHSMIPDTGETLADVANNDETRCCKIGMCVCARTNEGMELDRKAQRFFGGVCERCAVPVVQSVMCWWKDAWLSAFAALLI